MRLLPIISLAFALTANAQSDVASKRGTAVFEPTWENIAQNYECPEWYRDAKFGIFIHWGVYSVPAFGSEWYSRNMYIKDSNEWKHHRETWGEHDKFGYKDFIPMFKAEKFDARAWAKLFKEAGARYIIPVAEHHDGFAMYNSDLNPWNAAKMGPKRDIIGELKRAFEKEGLVFGTSTHRMENAWFFNGGMQFPSDVQDMSLSIYGQRAEEQKYNDEWCQDWLAHTREIIDKYKPRLLYFDWTVNADILRPYFNQMLAYYYNNAIDWKHGVVINTKQGFPTNVQVWDMERGKTDRMMQYPWQTDTSVGKRSWSYINGEENKTAQQIIHDMIDIVSKNGNLLLNIGPRADGTITEEQTEVLLNIGKWLKVNGDAIYGTRPWKRFGEGETKGSKGSFSDNDAIQYTARDIRFTTKGNTFYAIALNWADEIVIRSLTPENIGKAKIKSVKLLGSKAKLTYTVAPDGLHVKMPAQRPCDHAYSLKISFDKPVGENMKSEASNEMMKHGG